VGGLRAHGRKHQESSGQSCNKAKYGIIGADCAAWRHPLRSYRHGHQGLRAQAVPWDSPWSAIGPLALQWASVGKRAEDRWWLYVTAGPLAASSSFSNKQLVRSHHWQPAAVDITCSRIIRSCSSMRSSPSEVRVFSSRLLVRNRRRRLDPQHERASGWRLLQSGRSIFRYKGAPPAQKRPQYEQYAQRRIRTRFGRGNLSALRGTPTITGRLTTRKMAADRSACSAEPDDEAKGQASPAATLVQSTAQSSPSVGNLRRASWNRD